MAIKLKIILSLSIVVLSYYCQAAEEANGLTNLIVNGSFEDGPVNAPDGWKPTTWAGICDFAASSEAKSGKRSVTVKSIDGVDASWSSPTSIEPNSLYRLSGYIKTQNVEAGTGIGAFLNIHEMRGKETKPLTGTHDWIFVEVYFYSGGRDKVTVNCTFGGWGNSKGEVWYDDIKLERLSGADRQQTIRLDMSKTGYPISKYIYGQLIEHVGKCVYGGMWAQMLEDRKFYFPVTDTYNPYDAKMDKIMAPSPYYKILTGSPWKVIGPAGTVTMSNEAPFVGNHSPQIIAGRDRNPCGIEQQELALQKGRKYVGYIYLCGDRKAAPIQVSLIWGDTPDQKQTIRIKKLTGTFTKYALEFTSRENSDNGRLEIISSAKKGTFKIGCVSLMPADSMEGWRADVIDMLKELNSPIYKWPGGNFVSGYDWRDGIGPRDLRIPKKNPAWAGIEDNDVGIDEFMTLCRLLNTEPAIAVSSGVGTAQMAADEVQYVNGPKDTLMGFMRAKNGHPEPYQVKLWYIGNEMWGNHQAGYIPLDKYVIKHNEIAEAMKTVDPTVRLVAVGRGGYFGTQMMSHCSDYMDYISDNFYRGVSNDVFEHVFSLSSAVRQVVDGYEKYFKEVDSIKDKKIPLIIDEWGYWYSGYKYGDLGRQYCFQDALGIAAALHEMFRSSDKIEIVHYAQAVNVLGAIKTSRTSVVWDSPGLVLKLYRNNFGSIPLVIEESTTPLDSCASLSQDRKELTIGVVNPAEMEIPLKIDIKGVILSAKGKVFTLTAKSKTAFNEPGKEPEVVLNEVQCDLSSGILNISPTCVSLYKFQLQ